jgi:hypothetical protein
MSDKLTNEQALIQLKKTLDDLEKSLDDLENSLAEIERTKLSKKQKAQLM